MGGRLDHWYVELYGQFAPWDFPNAILVGEVWGHPNQYLYPDGKIVRLPISHLDRLNQVLVTPGWLFWLGQAHGMYDTYLWERDQKLRAFQHIDTLEAIIANMRRAQIEAAERQGQFDLLNLRTWPLFRRS
jgi:hypothetical protein